MSKKAKVTGVEWSWRDDQGGWSNYDAALSYSLEEGYKKGSKRIKVDKERFIDLDLDYKEICGNFTNVKLPKTVVGMQRRYDDETKRRAVQRVVPEFFAKEVFLLLGKMTKKQKTDLTETIETHGGAVSQSVTKKTTYVVCDEDEIDNFEDEAKAAVAAKIPIVSQDFIHECVVQKKKVGATKFEVEYQAKPEKRKAESSDDEEDKKPAKKAKTEEASKTTTTTNSSKSNSNSNSNVTSTTSSSSGIIDAPMIKAGVQMIGSCTMISDSSVYPQFMSIDERVDNKFSGTIQWPSLNSAKTKFRGTINGSKVQFEEYEVISGADDVEVPNKYSGTIASDGVITGKTEVSDPDAQSTFELKPVAAKVAKEYDSVKVGTKINGTAFVAYPFNLEVKKRSGSTFEGEIVWSSINNAKTLVKGSFSGDEIMFEEFESQSKDIELPVSYTGKLGPQTKVQGQFKAPQSNGTFEFNL